MKAGDVVTCHKGLRWLIYDIFQNAQLKIIYVVDFETNQRYEAMSSMDLIQIEEVPSNVRFLFIARRKKMAEKYGLEKYL